MQDCVHCLEVRQEIQKRFRHESILSNWKDNISTSSKRPEERWASGMKETEGPVGSCETLSALDIQQIPNGHWLLEYYVQLKDPAQGIQSEGGEVASG